MSALIVIFSAILLFLSISTAYLRRKEFQAGLYLTALLALLLIFITAVVCTTVWAVVMFVFTLLLFAVFGTMWILNREGKESPPNKSKPRSRGKSESKKSSNKESKKSCSEGEQKSCGKNEDEKPCDERKPEPCNKESKKPCEEDTSDQQKGKES